MDIFQMMVMRMASRGTIVRRLPNVISGLDDSNGCLDGISMHTHESRRPFGWIILGCMHCRRSWNHSCFEFNTNVYLNYIPYDMLNRREILTISIVLFVHFARRQVVYFVWTWSRRRQSNCYSYYIYIFMLYITKVYVNSTSQTQAHIVVVRSNRPFDMHIETLWVWIIWVNSCVQKEHIYVEYTFACITYLCVAHPLYTFGASFNAWTLTV